MKTTLKVRLADLPTDVLVHLVDQGAATITDLAAALSPPDSPAAAVSYAVDLLRRCGYVRCESATYAWTATDAGVAAVRDARAAQEAHQ